LLLATYSLHCQGSSQELDAIHASDGSVCAIRIGHHHESKSTGISSVRVFHHLSFDDL
jgi:hypothetical protein